MKIGQPADKPGIAPVKNPATAPTGTPKPAVAPEQAGADASAKVQLSSTASTMLGAKDADFDADKVARISQAIADGSFKINPEVIADKLITNAQEALGKVSG